MDDTNLLAGLGEDDDLDSIGIKGQEAVSQWGQSLIATGGALNPEKCFWTVHHMKCDNKGKWNYSEARQDTPSAPESPEEDEELDDFPAYESDEEDQEEAMDKLPPLTVPLANADAAAIKYLQSTEAVKNLGLFACPDGSTNVQLTRMQDKVEDWTKLVKNGYLTTRSLWTSYTHQLWAGLRYGMCASSTPLLT